LASRRLGVSITLAGTGHGGPRTFAPPGDWAISPIEDIEPRSNGGRIGVGGDGFTAAFTCNPNAGTIAEAPQVVRIVETRLPRP